MKLKEGNYFSISKRAVSPIGDKAARGDEIVGITSDSLNGVTLDFSHIRVSGAGVVRSLVWKNIGLHTLPQPTHTPGLNLKLI